MSDPGWIGPARAFLHVGKLVAQGRDAACGKALRVGLHRIVEHARARAVGEQIERFRVVRPKEQAGDLVGA